MLHRDVAIDGTQAALLDLAARIWQASQENVLQAGMEEDDYDEQLSMMPSKRAKVQS